MKQLINLILIFSVLISITSCKKKEVKPVEEPIPEPTGYWVRGTIHYVDSLRPGEDNTAGSIEMCISKNADTCMATSCAFNKVYHHQPTDYRSGKTLAMSCNLGIDMYLAPVADNLSYYVKAKVTKYDEKTRKPIIIWRIKYHVFSYKKTENLNFNDL